MRFSLLFLRDKEVKRYQLHYVRTLVLKKAYFVLSSRSNVQRIYLAFFHLFMVPCCFFLCQIIITILKFAQCTIRILKLTVNKLFILHGSVVDRVKTLKHYSWSTSTSTFMIHTVKCLPYTESLPTMCILTISGDISSKTYTWAISNTEC